LFLILSFLQKVQSRKSSRIIYRSLIVLIIQDTCLYTYLILAIHPIAHNVMLLLLTPAYRLFIMSSLRCRFYTESVASLLRETPPHQERIRNYLIFIQVLLILNDVYFDLLFNPIPLFPLCAAYCLGWLCHQSIVPLTFLALYAMLGVSIVLCCIFRHQQLL
ncbi:hypothetical protein PFISCL1PPCAC_12891, partial [Pristionchus fissidentatus]